MKRKMLVIISLLLAFAMMFSCVASAATATAGKAAKPLLDKPIKVKYGCPAGAVKVPDLNEPWFKEFTKKTNVTISNVTLITAPYVDKYSVLVNSGSLPDFFMIAAVPALDINAKLAKTGNILNYKPYIKQMPNMMKYVNKYKKDILNAHIQDANGNMYVTPNVYDIDTINMGMNYRKDIFDKNGIKAPRSQAELYSVLKKLKQLYPESYPLTTFNKGPGELLDIGSYIYNVNTASSWAACYYDTADKKWEFGPLKKQYKAMVTWLKKLYDEKLIDPEFLSNAGADTWNAKVSSEKTFMCYYWVDNNERTNKSIRESNKDFTMAAFTPVTTDGSRTKYTISPHAYENGLMVSNKSPYKKEMVKLVDWLYTDLAIAMGIMGLEGKSFEKDPDPKAKFPYRYTANVQTYDNSKGVSTNDLIKSPSWLNIVQLYTVFPELLFYTLWGSKELKGVKEEMKKSIQFTDVVVQPNFTKAENDERGKLEGALATTTDEYVSKFITGKLPMSDWDKFTKALKDLKAERVQQIWQTAAARK